MAFVCVWTDKAGYAIDTVTLHRR